jgi:hypothetical protein
VVFVVLGCGFPDTDGRGHTYPGGLYHGEHGFLLWLLLSESDFLDFLAHHTLKQKVGEAKIEAEKG